MLHCISLGHSGGNYFLLLQYLVLAAASGSPAIFFRIICAVQLVALLQLLSDVRDCAVFAARYTQGSFAVKLVLVV